VFKYIQTIENKYDFDDLYQITEKINIKIKCSVGRVKKNKKKAYPKRIKKYKITFTNLQTK